MCHNCETFLKIDYFNCISTSLVFRIRALLEKSAHAKNKIKVKVRLTGYYTNNSQSSAEQCSQIYNIYSGTSAMNKCCVIVLPRA